MPARLAHPPPAAAWLATAIVLSLILRLPFLHVPLITDEGGYAYVARRWLDGRGDLYRDLWFDRPQGIFLVYGLILHTLGTDVVAIRAAAWLASVLTLFVVWGFARDIRDTRAAWLAAILFAIIASSPAIEGFTANAEVFMALPAAGSAWLLLRASQNAWRRWTMLATGFLIGVATLLKPPGIVMLPVALAFTWLAGPVRISTIACRWAWLFAGFAVAITPSLVHGWLIGWADFASAVTYRLHHRSATTVAPEEHLVALFELGVRVWPLLAALALMVGAWWLRQGLDRRTTGNRHWPHPEASIPRLIAGRLAVTANAEPGILLRLWLLACLAGIAMGGNWFPHYLIQIAAPLAIWKAMLLRDLAPRLHRWQWWLLGTATGSLLLWPYSVVITTGGDAGALSRRLFDRETYPEQVAIASHLRACTAPGSPVYIAFYQASIYYLAGRPAAYRHLYRWELQETPGAEKELVAMLTSPQRPVAIVDMHQQAPFPDGGAAFWRVVAREYHLETAINGHAIYRADERDPRAAPPSTTCPHATNRHAFSSPTRLPAPPIRQPLREGLPQAVR